MQKKAVVRSARRLKTRFDEAGDFGVVYAGPWRAMGKRAREEIVLKVLAWIEGAGFDRVDRYSAPELTLANLAGGAGEGFLRLVNALLPNEDLPNENSVVRHEGWEKVCRIVLEGESLKSSGRSVRALEDEHLVGRHAFLLDFVEGVLENIVRCAFVDDLMTFANQFGMQKRTTTTTSHKPTTTLKSEKPQTKDNSSSDSREVCARCWTAGE